MLTRLLFTLLIFLGSIVFTALNAQTGSPAPKPNVVLICVDDLNDFAGFLNGQPQTYTPNMDRLAQGGTIFTNAYTAVPVCAASRNCFMSGKGADYSGIFSNEQYLLDIEPSREFRSLYDDLAVPLQVETFPQWLKDVGGYYTIGMGKTFHGWGRDGFDRDYDENHTDPCSRGLSWSEFRDFDPKNDPRPDFGLAGEFGDGVNNVSAGVLPNSKEVLMMDYQQTSSAVEFIQDYSNNPGDFCNRPFFMAVGMYRPHEPFTAPEKYFLDGYNADLYQRPYDLPYNYPSASYPPNGLVMPVQPDPIWSDYDNLSLTAQLLAIGTGADENFQTFHSALDSLPQFSDTLSLGERKQIVADSRRATSIMCYLASIRYVDAQVGRLLDALEADPALAANTVIILMTDHGFSLGEKKHWFKNGLWETDIRIPFVIKDTRIMGGRVQTSTASLIDLFPTLCDLAGIPTPTTSSGEPYLDGRSLKPGLDGTPLPGLRPAISTIQTPSRFSIGCYPFYSVRTERYHLIRYRVPLGSASCASGIFEDIFELYEIVEHREVDPNEWRNLANLPEYAQTIDWLKQFIPGEALAGTMQPVVQINTPDLGCTELSDTSVLALSCALNTDGTGTNPGDYTFRWRINDLDTLLNGASISLNFDSLPSNWFDNPTELLIQVQVIDSVDKVVSMDNFTMEVGAGTPIADFGASVISGARVKVEPVIQYPQTGTDFSRWNFGDGIVLDERQPDPHHYVNPGTYSVIHTRFYGPENSCSVSDTQSVVIPVTAYNSICGTPYPPLLVATGPTAAQLQITQVYNADYYLWRYRRAGHNDPVYSYASPSFDTEVWLDGLSEGTRYEVQTKAYCMDGNGSDWSLPVTMETARCQAPFKPTAEPGSTSAIVNWLPRDESTGGTVMYVFSPGTPFRQVFAGPGLSTKTLAPLIPFKFYRIFLLSVCDDISGAPTYIGQNYSKLEFRTLPLSAPGARLEESDERDLMVWPNPTNGVFQGVFDGASEPVTCRIYAEDGRLVQQQTVLPNSVFSADLSGMPAGIYHVEWVEMGLTKPIILNGR